MITVPIELGHRRYDVVIGMGARHLLAELLPPSVKQVAIVTQEGIPVHVDPGVDARRFVVPDGEAAKSLATIEQLCREFARAGLSRNDAVVAVGGGVVTDVAGFAAASYHRGVAYVNVATTLLAQVDAAIGGKTGVNLPEGKNLVGAFWQPSAVICDTETLETLPPREWASGRGEMAKYAFLSGGSLSGGSLNGGSMNGGSLDGGSMNGESMSGSSSGSDEDPSGLLELTLEEQVARCVRIKAEIVMADEHEAGRRMILNYGHTLAHALEAVSFGQDRAWDLRHGEAVATGLMFAARLARRLGRIDDDRVAHHRR
ncbi:MAG TPA: 3-dehydroquinate synthase family protein, partial [Acidimicrobiales bacterium]|nr:3-dehydroquinate synthase family protein [Acidimicrobiales bacterium]